MAEDVVSFSHSMKSFRNERCSFINAIMVRAVSHLLTVYLKKSRFFKAHVRNIRHLLGNKFWHSPWKGSKNFTFPSEFWKSIINRNLYTPWGYTYWFSSISDKKFSINTIFTCTAVTIQLSAQTLVTLWSNVEVHEKWS